MAKFYKTKIKTITNPTDDSVAITFDLDSETRKEFNYLPGQHLTVKAMIEGEDIRRSYSICSCPDDADLTIAVKRVSGGIFSNYALEKLTPGDELELMPPMGHFHPSLDPANEKTYLALASGSGITPVISIARTVLRREPGSRFILIYGNKKTSSIMFREEIEGLKNQHVDRFSIHHVLSQEEQDTELLNGRIDAGKIKVFASKYFQPGDLDEVFICGPEQMILQTKEALEKEGVDASKIHIELFTSPVGQLGGEGAAHEHAEAHAEVTVILDGNTHTFPYDSDLAILDVASDHGIDLPYACKGGVCSTCVARLMEGEVEMDVNYALEPDELEKGLVLSCQSFPKTAKVVLNFDV